MTHSNSPATYERRFRRQVLTCIAFCCCPNIGLSIFAQTTEPPVAARQGLQLTDDGKSLKVTHDQKLFTTYDYSSYKKPIFFPLIGPNQIQMTRSFPMEKIAGESTDHPHHKSMWIGHEINGIDFWTEKGGSVKSTKIEIADRSSFTASHDWISDTTGNTIVQDEVHVRFAADRLVRSIDYQIKFTAVGHDVKFADTKEGFFAVRVHPALRLANSDNDNSNNSATMLNSTGGNGKQIWGKRARWVDYSGIIDGQPCGIAVLDHPDNLRHPTTWHARDYGLLAANPFGLRYFDRKPKRAGQYTLKRGSEIVFRYKVLLHLDKGQPDRLNQAFENFARSPAPSTALDNLATEAQKKELPK